MTFTPMTLDPFQWLCRVGGPLPDPPQGGPQTPTCDENVDAPIELPEDGDEPLVN